MNTFFEILSNDFNLSNRERSLVRQAFHREIEADFSMLGAKKNKPWDFRISKVANYIERQRDREGKPFPRQRFVWTVSTRLEQLSERSLLQNIEEVQ